MSSFTEEIARPMGPGVAWEGAPRNNCPFISSPTPNFLAHLVRIWCTPSATQSTACFTQGVCLLDDISVHLQKHQNCCFVASHHDALCQDAALMMPFQKRFRRGFRRGHPSDQRSRFVLCCHVVAQHVSSRLETKLCSAHKCSSSIRHEGRSSLRFC